MRKEGEVGKEIGEGHRFGIWLKLSFGLEKEAYNSGGNIVEMRMERISNNTGQISKWKRNILHWL